MLELARVVTPGGVTQTVSGVSGMYRKRDCPHDRWGQSESGENDGGHSSTTMISSM